MSTFTPFAEKMESAGVSAAAVNAFSRCYEALVSNHSGMIPETDILPADQVEDWQDITASTPAADKDLISRCVCIKLNGGLGTSMGLQKAKSPREPDRVRFPGATRLLLDRSARR